MPRFMHHWATPLFLFLLTLQVKAAESLTVVAANWESFTDTQGRAIYTRLVKEVFNDFNINFEVSTYKRARHQFIKHKADIIIGVYRAPFEGQFIIPRKHLDFDYPVVAYYNSDITTLKGKQEIAGLSAAWFENYEFAEFMPAPKHYYPITDLKTGFSLLVSGRVQALVDYHENRPIDLPPNIKELEVIPPMPIYLAFQATAEGAKLAQIYDTRIQELIESGFVEKVFGDKYANTRFDSVRP